MRAARCLAFSLALLAATSAQAQTPPRYDPRYEPNPQERALEQAERVLKQMLDILRTIPSYDPPVVTEEGDILIRRRPPRPMPGDQPYPHTLPPPVEPPTRL